MMRIGTKNAAFVAALALSAAPCGWTAARGTAPGSGSGGVVTGLPEAALPSGFVSTSIDSLLLVYPLREGTAAKTVEIGRLQGSSVHFLETRTGVRPHFHRDRDEVVYVVSGKAVLLVGPERALLGDTAETTSADEALRGAQSIGVHPGSLVMIPRGTAHKVLVPAGETLVAVSVFSPPFGDNDRHFLTEGGK